VTIELLCKKNFHREGFVERQPQMKKINKMERKSIAFTPCIRGNDFGRGTLYRAAL
jgi:hypothetical protein